MLIRVKLVYFRRILIFKDDLTGMRNARVFPDPVLAAPRMSCPCRASPMDSLWISVGVVNFAFWSPERLSIHENFYGLRGLIINELSF